MFGCDWIKNVIPNIKGSNGWYSVPQGEVRSRGFDLEVAGALTEDLQLFAGYTFNVNEYRETESTRYLKGSSFNAYTPKHLFRLYASYRLPVLEKKLTAGGGMNAQSRTTSLYGVEQGGYAVFNANLRYQATDNLEFRLIASNLFDRRYYVNNKVRTRGMNNFYADPFNVMLTADLTF